MSACEDFINRLNDLDWSWWPFLRLRPPRHEPFTTLRVATVALAFAALPGALLGIASLLMLGSWDATIVVRNVSAGMGATTGLFFIVFRFVFAVCWNRRAARLRASQAEQPNAAQG
ncbi:MAG: hypothetical protein ACOX6T_21420 [Myxococcales bacterium]|jgi:hypothetical protein